MVCKRTAQVVIATGALEEHIELEGAVKRFLYTVQRCAIIDLVRELQHERRIRRSLALILLIGLQLRFGVSEHTLREDL